MQTRAARHPERTRLSGRLSDTYDVLDAAGLWPVLDTELERVLSRCPRCQGGTSYPHSMYRPLVVGCYSQDRSAPVRLRCSAHGCSPAQIRAALARPPVDWQALASEYEQVAADALAQFDATLRPAAVLRVAA